MAHTENLVSREGTWYFREDIPFELRNVSPLGKGPEYKRSLKTKDYQAAKVLNF